MGPLIIAIVFTAGIITAYFIGIEVGNGTRNSRPLEERPATCRYKGGSSHPQDCPQCEGTSTV